MLREYAVWEPIVIAIACCAVFANALHNSFHLDDFYRVVDNPGIRQINQPWRHFVDPHTMSTLDRILGYRPLLPLTLSINYAIAGDSLVGYHIGNLALQLIAACLVYALGIELLSALPRAEALARHTARSLALVAALLFAIHPISGIAVNYICARDQLLSQLFWGAALLYYTRTRQRPRRAVDWAMCLGLFSLSLLAKGDAVSAPLVILALELTLLGRSWRQPGVWLRAAAFGLPVLALLAFQRWVLGGTEVDQVLSVKSFGAFGYPLTQARLHLFRYLPSFVWPFSMHQDPNIEVSRQWMMREACGVTFVVGSLVAAWHWRKTQPLIAFCTMAYWAMLAPTSSFVPLIHLAVDYRPYPASPFLFLAACYFVYRLRSPARAWLASGAIAYFAACSVYLNQTWRTERSLWSYSVKHGGGALAHLNLASTFSDPNVRRVLLQRALVLEPDYILAQINLGVALIDAGSIDAGLRRLAATARARPGHAQAQYWYARALLDAGDAARAYPVAVHAAELDPRNGRAVYQAALAAQAADKHEAALRWLDLRQRLEPEEPLLRFSRGFSLQQLGRLDEAILCYRQHLTDHPRHVQAHFNLGYALKDQRSFSGARREFEQVLTLDPQKPGVHLHLAECSRALGDPVAAERHETSWNAVRAEAPGEDSPL